ncbi:hypothetical protein BT96DRAFT_927085 [Gymnopus androsaceus JB14]|uniref:FAD/NAD(P)-binding domain-containing protein n=1 Tax=Gymnopus androsaceus JB14 TaxID=1447944 RepID=A0A6A4GRQ8_9AGAR|nr:hypothetical protein BT96DRAFT_927085 [Gymnopus androsaceus JB14]
MIILATGSRYAFPFLPQYHDGSHETIPIGGCRRGALHLDLFYIEEPTIGFINMHFTVSIGIESFMFSEFATSALAKVWVSEAKLLLTKKM